MNRLSKISLGFFTAAFIYSGSAIAQDITIKAPEAPQQPVVNTPKAPDLKKPDFAESIKSKANETINKTQQKVDNAAEKLKQPLGDKKDKAVKSSTPERSDVVKNKADKAKSEIVDVEQETVIVETPNGTAQETTTTIIPEKLAPSAKPAN